MTPRSRSPAPWNGRVRSAWLLALLWSFTPAVAAQTADSARDGARVSATLSVTNKGISTIPSFTLGRPAAVLDLAIRKGRLGFEPQFRYALDGKPWSFLFWGRYRLHDGERLRVTLGAHPALSFRTVRDSTGGIVDEQIVARRYLAGEASSSYSLARNVSVGPYYLYSYGVERNVARHTHFLALRGQLGSSARSDRYQVRVAPQAYYLRVAEHDGYYLNATVTLTRQGLPITLSSQGNWPIRTHVPGGGRSIWNLSASYTFQ